MPFSDLNSRKADIAWSAVLLANLLRLALSTLLLDKVFVRESAAGALLAGNERQRLFWAGSEWVGALRWWQTDNYLTFTIMTF